MATLEISERLTRLEEEVERLKSNAQAHPDKTVPWWEEISGVFKDCPAFEEAMRLGREWRESQQMEYDDANCIELPLHHETALLSEASLAEDWNRPEEEEVWS